MLKKALVTGILALALLYPSYSQRDNPDVRFVRENTEHHRMFLRVEAGIVYCYSANSKTTGIFVSKDGWILTAGHKVDKDFPEAHVIHVKMNRTGKDLKIYKSTKIIPPQDDFDLVLFKIDYKPKFYFKKFRLPHKYEVNWVFGFRGESEKVPSPPGYITANLFRKDLLLSTASTCGGNSGSPVLSEGGEVLGVIVVGYAFGDSFFIPGEEVKKFIKENLQHETDNRTHSNISDTDIR